MKRVPTFATNVLLMFLVGALASAQTVAGQPNRVTQNATTQDETSQHADESGKNHNSEAKKQNKKPGKAKSKAAPSQEEKDFDRVLLGIFG